MERFWSKVNKTEGCWEWTASLRTTGYGQINVNGKPLGAHRVSYELAYGPIPSGLWVLHRCDNRKCVRPDHLFLGDRIDNIQDMWNKGRGKIVHHSGGDHHYGRLTHCKRGHEFSDTNTDILKSGSRRCRACRKIRGS